MNEQQFIKGVVLAEAYYRDAIRPVLDRELPQLVYSAALLGSGSEVQGLDTAMSADHNWGPRCDLYVAESEREQIGPEIMRALSERLPTSFMGLPTSFERVPGEPRTRIGVERRAGPIDPFVSVMSPESFVRSKLGVELGAELSAVDWITIPQQQLRGVVGGRSASEVRVFHDGLGTLEVLRRRFEWYPHDVWLYLMAGEWQQIGQEEPFVGRTGSVGDELGSRVIASRLVERIVRLTFLMEREYAPYSKWLGTAFRSLACWPRLGPPLAAVLAAEDWRAREAALCDAYRTVARMHNELGITEELSEEPSAFHNRPFWVIHGERFAAALWSRIDDPDVLQLPEGIGGVDAWVESTDVLSSVERVRRLAEWYAGEALSA